MTCDSLILQRDGTYLRSHIEHPLFELYEIFAVDTCSLGKHEQSIGLGMVYVFTYLACSGGTIVGFATVEPRVAEGAQDMILHETWSRT